jgi:hypothetical protein
MGKLIKFPNNVTASKIIIDNPLGLPNMYESLMAVMGDHEKKVDDTINALIDKFDNNDTISNALRRYPTINKGDAHIIIWAIITDMICGIEIDIEKDTDRMDLYYDATMVDESVVKELNSIMNIFPLIDSVSIFKKLMEYLIVDLCKKC